jgi:branched-chain amino acid transport system ATP-binding protein
MTAPALELIEVSAAYGPYRALFGVSFRVPAGGVMALLGPNGAGKSTVARVASGLLATTGGRVALGGCDVTGAPAWRIARAGLAHVPEGRAIFANLSVEENLILGLRRHAGRGGGQGWGGGWGPVGGAGGPLGGRRRDVSEALERTYERFGTLGERRRQRAGTLSGGQQRQLALAAALVVPPDVLLADELSLGLAPGVVDDVYRGLEVLHREGTALVLVEQQVDRVLALATHAVVLDHGAVVYSGPPDAALEAVEQVVASRRSRDKSRDKE